MILDASVSSLIFFSFHDLSREKGCSRHFSFQYFLAREERRSPSFPPYPLDLSRSPRLDAMFHERASLFSPPRPSGRSVRFSKGLTFFFPFARILSPDPPFSPSSFLGRSWFSLQVINLLILNNRDPSFLSGSPTTFSGAERSPSPYDPTEDFFFRGARLQPSFPLSLAKKRPLLVNNRLFSFVDLLFSC